MRLFALNLFLFHIWPVILLAQLETAADALKQKFEQSVTNVHQEKVFMHSDKPFYFTGETIWFKAYCVDASFHTLSAHSRVLYVELINSAGQAVIQEKVGLTSGTGSGQFLVDQTLTSGSYFIRAYTSWMKNWDDTFFFEKAISIINPFVPVKKPGVPPNLPDLLVAFFPEGGPLVYGIESKVAFQSVDKEGLSVKSKGIIKDQEGREICPIRSSDQGIGTFQFTPELGNSYKADITDIQGKSIEFTLPRPEESGINLTVTDNPEAEVFDVGVRSKNVQDQPLFLIVHTRGIPGYSQFNTLDKGETNFQIPKERLMDGVSHITLFNTSFQPIAERLVFLYPDKDTALKLSTEKATYGNRERVRLSIDYQSPSAVDENIQMSISVYKAQPKLDRGNNGIKAYLLLDSDLPGYVETPDHYFSSVNDSTIEQLDNLLLVNSWQRFSWKDVLATDHTKKEYPLEMTGHFLSGQGQGDLLDGKVISIIFPGKSPELFSTYFDEDGHFQIQLPIKLSSGQVLFHSPEVDEVKIELESGFLSPSGQSVVAGLNADETMRSFIENYSIHTQINTAYLDHSEIQGSEIDGDPLRLPFYGEAEHQYLLDDYTRFPTMDEIFLEYIRDVQVRKVDGVPKLHVNYLYSNLYSQANFKELGHPAMVMIDGIPVNDLDFIFGLDPLKVEKIEIVTRRFVAGKMTFAGIINLTTYAGDFAGQELPPYVVRKLYKGLQRAKEFGAVKYEHEGLTRIPDYRKVLWWEPNASMDSEKGFLVDFFTSDDEGEFRIEVNGISESGIPLHSINEFRVENMKQ